MDYKVSVIIPVYNAEKNLETAINSIINQTIGFENVELILVDDNSTDNSKNIIKKYSNKYHNITPYFSNENHGFPGFGRNMGLKLATSKYIMFLDNDDEYKEDMCETLYKTITSENVDYVGCNKITIDPISNIKQILPYKNGIESEDKVFIEKDDILLFDSTAVWSKIFKKEIIDRYQIKFLENTHADDLAFTLDYSLHITTLIYLKNYHGIYWKVYDDSLSHTVTKEFMTQTFNTYHYLCNQLKKEKKEKYISQYMSGKISYLILQSSYLDSDNKEFKEILKDIRTFEKEIKFNAPLNSKWEDLINDCIMNEHYSLAMILLKTISKIRKFKILRKINRMISK